MDDLAYFLERSSPGMLPVANQDTFCLNYVGFPNFGMAIPEYLGFRLQVRFVQPAVHLVRS